MPSHMSTLSTCMSAHMSICMSARQAGGVPVMNPDGISACQLRGIDCVSQTTHSDTAYCKWDQGTLPKYPITSADKAFTVASLLCEFYTSFRLLTVAFLSFNPLRVVQCRAALDRHWRESTSRKKAESSNESPKFSKFSPSERSGRPLDPPGSRPNHQSTMQHFC